MSDVKIAYGASSALTITLGSLASSTARVGRQSTLVDNTSNLYLDYLISGKITLGTTPTVSKTVQVWAFGTFNDAFALPDVFGASDAAATLTSDNVWYAGAMQVVAQMTSDATTDLVLYFGPRSIAQVFGGQVPKKWGIWVVHDTVAVLNATGGNHVISIQPVYNTVI